MKNTCNIKKQYKKTIKDKKNSFFRKALPSKSSKTVWNSINRILNKQQKRINHGLSEMNNFFLATLQRILLTKKILKVTLQHS